uniref:Uncharacterized protein n=1 Tax=Arundo donax TaxID=35708 RepID=A0A0A8YI23_ARUDO
MIGMLNACVIPLYSCLLFHYTLMFGYCTMYNLVHYTEKSTSCINSFSHLHTCPNHPVI